MPQSDPNRTEDATPKRRQKARDEGNVAKGEELPKVVSILVGLITLHILIGFMGSHLTSVFVWIFGPALKMEMNPDNIHFVFTFCLRKIALIIIPIMLILAFFAFLTQRLQVGKLWTTKVFQPKLAQKLNIFSGIQKVMISTQTVVKLVKSVLQAIAIGIAPYLVLKSEMHNFLPLFYQNVEGIVAYILSTASTMVIYALVPMLIIALADLFYQRWDYEENLKMTQDEVKDEKKQAEGDPEVKQEQRQKMMGQMQQRMLDDVPKADVVITNPTHYAVALRYDPTESPAPMLIAKGLDHLAEKIKEIARENKVPVKENKPLAQALYKSVEVGEPIPEEMYQAVASILAQLYKYKRQNQ